MAIDRCFLMGLLKASSVSCDNSIMQNDKELHGTPATFPHLSAEQRTTTSAGFLLRGRNTHSSHTR